MRPVRNWIVTLEAGPTFQHPSLRISDQKAMIAIIHALTIRRLMHSTLFMLIIGESESKRFYTHPLILRIGSRKTVHQLLMHWYKMPCIPLLVATYTIQIIIVSPVLFLQTAIVPGELR